MSRYATSPSIRSVDILGLKRIPSYSAMYSGLNADHMLAQYKRYNPLSSERLNRNITGVMV